MIGSDLICRDNDPILWRTRSPLPSPGPPSPEAIRAALLAFLGPEGALAVDVAPQAGQRVRRRLASLHSPGVPPDNGRRLDDDDDGEFYSIDFSVVVAGEGDALATADTLSNLGADPGLQRSFSSELQAAGIDGVDVGAMNMGLDPSKPLVCAAGKYQDGALCVSCGSRGFFCPFAVPALRSVCA